MSPTSRLSIAIDGDRIVVAGEVDAHSCSELSAAFEAFVGSGDVRIDVADVAFMDSSGLRVVIEAHKRSEKAGNRLIVERPSKPVLRIIEVSGLLDHLHVVHAD